jgi:cell division protein FtsQ
MTDPLNPVPEPPKEDLAVTEVSQVVLNELSSLFAAPSTGQSSAVNVTADDTEPLVLLEPEESHGVRVIKPEEEAASMPVVAVAPVDPLLKPISGDSDFTDVSDDSGGTVVIDVDEVDRVVIVDDDRPDPTFEERRRRHERRERLKKVKWFKLSGVIVGGVIVVLAILASPLFAIRSVDFEGTVYTSQETIDSVRAAMKDVSVFTVDAGEARQKMLDDPWVADVRITTSFPGSALVEVSEREPVVWYVGDDEKARIVDARGFVIEVLDGWPTKYLRVLGTGPSLSAGAIADDSYRAAAQLVLALPEEIRSKVQSLDLSAGGELSMILKGGTLIRFGPPTNLQNKLVGVVVLLRRQDPATLAVIDVSTGQPSVQVR